VLSLSVLLSTMSWWCHSTMKIQNLHACYLMTYQQPVQLLGRSPSPSLPQCSPSLSGMPHTLAQTREGGGGGGVPEPFTGIELLDELKAAWEVLSQQLSQQGTAVPSDQPRS
jgi:hypothetical protein